MKYHQPFQVEHMYHVFNRAIGSEKLFRTEENYRYFLQKVSDYIEPIADIFAYNLLPNHFHLVLRFKPVGVLRNHYYLMKQKRVNSRYKKWPPFLSQQFSNCFNAYAKAYNKQYGRKGSLFIDYVKRVPIEDVSYFQNLVHYVHYNACHHGICKDPKDWPWSSYGHIVSFRTNKWQTRFLLEMYGGIDHFIQFHGDVPIIRGEEMEWEEEIILM